VLSQLVLLAKGTDRRPALLLLRDPLPPKLTPLRLFVSYDAYTKSAIKLKSVNVTQKIFRCTTHSLTKTCRYTRRRVRSRIDHKEVAQNW
jgi:hypothetical protein